MLLVLRQYPPGIKGMNMYYYVRNSCRHIPNILCDYNYIRLEGYSNNTLGIMGTIIKVVILPEE
jgi:hypothetical protein